MTGLSTLKLGGVTVGSGTTKGTLILGSEASISGLNTLTLGGSNASLSVGSKAAIAPASGTSYTTLNAADGVSVTNQGTLNMLFNAEKISKVNNYYDLRIHGASTFGDATASTLTGSQGRIYVVQGATVAGLNAVTIDDGHLVVAGTLNLGNGTLTIQDYGKLIFEIGATGDSDTTINVGKVTAGTVQFPTDATQTGAKIGLRLGESVDDASKRKLSGKSGDIIVATLKGAVPVLDTTLTGVTLNDFGSSVNTTATVTVSLSFTEDPGENGTALSATPPAATPRPSPYAGASSSGGGGGTALGVVGLGTLLWLLRQSTITESEYQAGGLTGIPGLDVAGETHRLGAGGAWTAHQSMGRDRTHQAWGMQLLERGSWRIGFLAGQSRVRADRSSASFAHSNALSRGNEFAFYGHWKEGAWGGSVLLAHSRQRAQTSLADATGAYSARTTGHGYMAQASIGREFEVRGWRLRPQASLIGVRFEESGFSAANEAFSVRRNAAHWDGALVGTGLDASYDMARSPASGRFLRLRAHAAVAGRIAGGGSTQHFVHEDHAGALSYKSSARTLAEAEQTQYAVGIGVQSGQDRGWHFGSGYMAATDAEGGMQHGVMLGVHRAF